MDFVEPLEVVVKVYGLAKHVVRDEETRLRLPREARVKDALNLMTEKYGEEVRKLLFNSEGGLRKTVKIFLGKKLEGSMEAPVAGDGEDSTEVSLFILPMVGGA